jgi:hypothetical protein
LILCSKESNETQQTTSEDPIPANEIVDLNLNTEKISPFEITFNINIPNNYTNKKILWGANENVTIDLYTGFQDIIGNGNSLVVKKLKKETTYFFRLAAFENDIIHYSEVLPFTTSGIEITFNEGVDLPGINGNIQLKRIIETNDGGYLIAAEINPQFGQDSYITVAKIDEDFNLEWSKNINTGSDSEYVKGLYSLPDGGYMLLANEYRPSGVPPFTKYLCFIAKFNNGGEVLWNEYYRYREGNNDLYYLNNFLPVTNDPEVLKFVIISDSTRDINGDTFAWEARIDTEGTIINRYDINHNTYLKLGNLKYDQYGNKFSYSAGSLSGTNKFIEKYDAQGNSLWVKYYGPQGTGGPIGNFYFDDEKIVYATADESVFLEKSNWIFRTNSTGDIVWDYKVREDSVAYIPPNNPAYKGRSLIPLENEEFTAFYTEGGSLNSFTTFNDEGHLLWKFYDEEIYKPNYFAPHASFSKDNSFIMFGLGSKPNPRLWIKNFVLTEIVTTP